jgi:hypothetical protein
MMMATQGKYADRLYGRAFSLAGESIRREMLTVLSEQVIRLAQGAFHSRQNLSDESRMRAAVQENRLALDSEVSQQIRFRNSRELPVVSYLGREQPRCQIGYPCDNAVMPNSGPWYKYPNPASGTHRLAIHTYYPIWKLRSR